MTHGFGHCSAAPFCGGGHRTTWQHWIIVDDFWKDEMTSRAGLHTDGLWAITSYFNPVGYRRRLSNFRIFRERLKVPLVVVELTYGSDFELQEQDADILIQLRGGAVLWQKERLLNLALQS